MKGNSNYIPNCPLCGELFIEGHNCLKKKYEAALNNLNKKDNVNPPHYKQGTIECIDAMRSALTPDEFRGYIKGTMIKYLWRERFKGGDEDIKKAVRFAEFLIKEKQ